MKCKNNIVCNIKKNHWHLTALLFRTQNSELAHVENSVYCAASLSIAFCRQKCLQMSPGKRWHVDGNNSKIPAVHASRFRHQGCSLYRHTPSNIDGHVITWLRTIGGSGVTSLCWLCVRPSTTAGRPWEAPTHSRGDYNRSLAEPVTDCDWLTVTVYLNVALSWRYIFGCQMDALFKKKNMRLLRQCALSRIYLNESERAR